MEKQKKEPMKSKTTWLTKVSALALLGVVSVYAACNTEVSVKCKAVEGARTVQSPNFYDPYWGPLKQPTYGGTVSESGSKSAITGIDWNNSCALGYDGFSQSGLRDCSYTCVVTSDCFDLSPEVPDSVSIIDTYLSGDLCDPSFN